MTLSKENKDIRFYAEGQREVTLTQSVMGEDMKPVSGVTVELTPGQVYKPQSDREVEFIRNHKWFGRRIKEVESTTIEAESSESKDSDPKKSDKPIITKGITNMQDVIQDMRKRGITVPKDTKASGLYKLANENNLQYPDWQE